MTETLPTGIEILDRKLDGGIPAGRVVALSAAPVSQSELFLYEMAAARPTTYLTTERTREDIHESLETAGTPLEGIDVYRISSTDPLVDAREAIDDLSDGSTLIVDPIRLLENQDPEPYRRFMNEVRTQTAETGGLTLLHCLEGRGVSDQRDRTEYLADIVFSLNTKLRGDSVQNNLTIPKFRGGQALPEAITLDLTADVTVDVSRKIA